MPEAEAKKSNRIFLFLRIAVVVGGVILAIIWVSDEQRWAEFKAIFAQMSILVFAGTLGIFGLAQLLIGVRWWLLLRTQGIFISYWTAVKLYLLGWFYNNVMPSSVGGDLVRLWYVTKHTDKKFEAALSVLVDRMIGLISTLIIAAFFYIVFLRSEGKKIDFVADTATYTAKAVTTSTLTALREKRSRTFSKITSRRARLRTMLGTYMGATSR